MTLENTHNHAGGLVFPQERAEALAAFAREQGLGVHLDGARLWNAHVASGVPLPTMAAVADTVSVCFSKGLGAPVGSALAFPAARRADAMRLRRRMGGALRQAGILAAAALHAIEHHLDDLAQDHWRAKKLATALEPLGADPEKTETNIVVFAHEDAAAFVARAADAGVKLSAMGPRVVRLTTHRDLDDDAIERAIERLRELA